MKILINKMKYLLILIFLTGCSAFDVPRLDVPFAVFDANDNINAYPSADDQLVWGQKDYWATPKELEKKGAGDCEDYAIAKYFALRKAGIPASKMLLVVGDVDAGAHMVLFVKYKETFVLDNIEQKVTPLKDYLDFKVLYKFNEDGVHFNGLAKLPISYLPKWKNIIDKTEDLWSRKS